MAYLSRVSYPSDGATRIYTVPFQFIERGHVKVTVNSVPTTAFTFLSDTQIELTVAAAAGLDVTIYRDTPKAAKLVDYSNGAALVESALDLSNDQLLFITQEAYDLAQDAKLNGGGGSGGGGGVADSVAWADVTGKPTTFTPSTHNHAEADITGLAADLAGKASATHNHDATYEAKNANIQAHISNTSNPHSTTAAQVGAVPAANVGAANGVAPLGSDSKVPSAYLSPAVTGQMAYQTVYDATTGSPALPASDASTKGHYWLVNVAGTQIISGLGTVDLQVGDWLVADGAGGYQKIDNTDAISSWNGRTGAIMPTSGDYDLDMVPDTATRVAVSPAQAALIHDPATIGTHLVDESNIADFRQLVYDVTSGKLVYPTSAVTLTANSATPSLSGKGAYYTLGGYTSPTNVTDFLSASGGSCPDGTTIIIRGGTNATLVHNTSVMRLAGGTNYNFASSSDFLMLTRFASIWFEVTRSAMVRLNTYTAKGDIAVGLSAGAVGRVALGTDGQMLVVDTSLSTGVKWATKVGPTIDYTLGFVAVTGATTLTSTAFGRAHSLTGTTYTVTLPTPVAGNSITLKCNNCGLVTLDSGTGITIEGVQQRQIWGYESVTLYAQNTTTWVATERVKIPISVCIAGNANQIPTVATWTQLTYTTAYNATAPAGVQDAANGRIIIPRAATWELMHVLHNQATNTTAHQVGCRIYKNGSLFGPSMTTSVPASSYTNNSAVTTDVVAAGDIITPWGFYSAGTYTTSFTLSTNCRLIGTEVSFW